MRANGIKYESAAAGAEKISGVHINKLGAYLYRKLTDKGKQPEKLSDQKKSVNQFGLRFTVGHINDAKLSMLNAQTAKK